MSQLSKPATEVGMLSFYDHQRQSYGHLPIRDGEAEFMVGDYGQPGENQGCGPGGEFAIILHSFSHDAYLAPQVRVFGDARGAFRAFVDGGVWDAICDTNLRTKDDLTFVLQDAGLHDRSDYPVGHTPTCHCCGRPVQS